MTGTISSQNNLLDCAGRLLEVAAAIQTYRFSKPGITPEQRSDLDSWEHLFRSKALHIAKDVADTILSGLKTEIANLQASTKKVKAALDKLEFVSDVIKGMTELLQVVNAIIRVL